MCARPAAKQTSAGDLRLAPAEADSLRESLRNDSIGALGERYGDEYGWADPLAVQLCLRADAASAAHKSAATRLVHSLGMERTTGRYTVLRALYFSSARRLNQVDIGNDIRVSSANVTYLVDGLEKEGFVRRLGDPRDRRVTMVELTPEGEALCAVLIPAMAELMKAIGAGFSEDEKLLFNQFLERFRQCAESLYRDGE